MYFLLTVAAWIIVATLILQNGLPFWPLLMGTVVVMAIAGAVRGARAWVAPMVILSGYVAMRGVMGGFDPPLQPLAAFFVWLIVSILLVRLNAVWTGFMYLLSGTVYPVFLFFGVGIEYLGLAAIAAEIFAILALLGIGGGFFGYTRPMDIYGDIARSVSFDQSGKMDLAKGNYSFKKDS